MSQYVFPGFSVFLEAAASRLCCPEAVPPARKITTLAALANLCAQVADAPPSQVPAVLAKAEEFHDQLRVALVAAEIMLAEVRLRHGVAEVTTPEESFEQFDRPHKGHKRGESGSRPGVSRS